ncbi:MAG: extracellular solute-binding protein [Anaerolineae bacterium]
MRNIRTITLMVLLALVLAAFTLPTLAQDTLPAYTGGPAEIRMGWWGNDDRAARTLAVIDLFQAAYPDIKVTGEPNGGTADHFQIIDTQLAGNNAPDIIQFGGNWPDYKQYLEPLNDYVGNQLMINTPEMFDQTALIPATDADGNLYAVSLGTNTLVLAYNKTMIEAAGVDLPADNMSWEDLLDYGRTLKAALPEGVAPFVDNSMNQANYLSYFYTQEGTPIWTLDNGGTSYATVESAQKWLQMWSDMRSEGLIPDADTTYTYTEDGPDSSAFVAGKAAIDPDLEQSGRSLSGSHDRPNRHDDASQQWRTGVCYPDEPVPGDQQYQPEQGSGGAVHQLLREASPKLSAILQTNRGVPSSPVVRQAIADQAAATDAAVYRIYDAIADRTIPQGRRHSRTTRSS